MEDSLLVLLGVAGTVIVALLGLFGYREYGWRNGSNSQHNPGSLSPEFAALARENRTLLVGLGEKIEALSEVQTSKLDHIVEVLIEVREIARRR